MTPAWVTPTDIAAMQDAVAGLVAGWTDTLLWLRHIDSRTPLATPAPEWHDTLKQTLVANGVSFGLGWEYAGDAGYIRPALPLVGGIWNTSETELLTTEGLVTYSGAILVYQSAVPVQKFDVIVDGPVRYAVGDQLSTIQAFGVSILRYAALEERLPGDRIYAISLT